MLVPPPPPPPAEVTWEAPEQCPDGRSVQAAVRDRVGGSEDGKTLVHAHARVQQRDDGRFEAAVDLDGQTRRLDADTCAALADAFALLVAIHVDSVRSGASAEPLTGDRELAAERIEPEVDESAETESAAPASRPTVPPQDTAAPRPRSRAITGVLRPEASVQFQIVGPVAGAIGLGGGVRIGLARIEGQLRWIPPHELRLGDNEPSARVQLATFGIAACVEPSYRRVAFPLCASVHAGAARARGRDRVASPEVAWEPWVSAAGTAGVRVSVAPRVALRLAGGPEVPFIRRRFVVGPTATPVHDPGPIGGHVAFGVEVEFSSRRGRRSST
jgi:hypothetical protein